MFIFVILLHVGMCFALEQSEDIFCKANTLCAEGSFDKALLEYKKLSDKTGAVWFNMANAAYEQQDYTHALLYWLRAQKYGDAHIYTESSRRLQQLNTIIGDPESSMGGNIVYYGTLLLKKIPVLVWQLLVLLFWCIFCWCWIKRQRCSRTKLSVLILLLFLLFIPLSIGYYIDKDMAIAVESVDVYNGPNSALYKVGTLQKNALTRILNTKKQWYKISHADIIGWVERKAIAKI